MALSVIGDAPVLMKVANPSSQDRTPRRAIPLVVSPAAGPYRASGLVLWRKADTARRAVSAWCHEATGEGRSSQYQATGDYLNSRCVCYKEEPKAAIYEAP